MNKTNYRPQQRIKYLIESIVGNVLLTEADEIDLGALDDAGGEADVGSGPDETSESDLGTDMPACDDAGGELDFGGGSEDGASGGEGDGEDGESDGGDLESGLSDDTGGDLGGGSFGGGGFGGGGGSMGLDSGSDGDSSESKTEDDSTGVDNQVIDLSDADPVKSTTNMAVAMLDKTGDDQKILNAVKASIQGNFESFDEALPIIKSLWDTNHPVLKIVARKLLFFIKGE